jgi:hypothetical protein
MHAAYPASFVYSDLVMPTAFVTEYVHRICWHAVQPSNSPVRLGSSWRFTQNNRQNHKYSSISNRDSCGSSVAIVTKLRAALHWVRMPLRSNDYLFSKTPRLALIQVHFFVYKYWKPFLGS